MTYGVCAPCFAASDRVTWCSKCHQAVPNSSLPEMCRTLKHCVPCLEEALRAYLHAIKVQFEHILAHVRSLMHRDPQPPGAEPESLQAKMHKHVPPDTVKLMQQCFRQYSAASAFLNTSIRGKLDYKIEHAEEELRALTQKQLV